MTKLKEFKDLGLSDELLFALEKKGFEKPSPIQALTIPALLNGDKDIIGQAQTGTGKTAAFSLPIIERFEKTNKKAFAVVLAPTRELAVQVSEEMNSLKGKKKMSILPIYGGQSIERQIKAIKRGVDIIVGTPGRIMDLMRRKVIKFDALEYFILDEADEMLNMGFLEDIEEILSHTNDEKRMLFFSATMPKEIITVAGKFMGDYEVKKVESKEVTNDLVEQLYFEVRESDKFEALCRILDVEIDFYGIVFCKRKMDVDDVVNHLIERGYDAEAIHGDISQHQREKTLTRFKNKTINLLIATDVAARGIDVGNLTHVVNYSLPQEAEAYVHRIGRTGRAGNEGVAITFVTPRESRKLMQIQRVAKAEIKKKDIPQVAEIIEAKKESLHAFVNEIIEEKDHQSYIDFAKELTINHDPIEVLSAILRHTYDEEFEASSYKDIKDVNIKFDEKTRLFVGMGRKDNLTPKKLLEMVYKEAHVKGRKIRDIRIMNDFSFMTMPFVEAEKVIEAFKRQKRRGKPLIERAKR